VILKQRRELSHSSRTILTAHTLHTRTDTNLNHTSLDSIGNLNTSLQTRTALTVQRMHSSTIREARSQSRSTELGGAAAGRQYTANGDIFDQRGIDFGTLDQCFKGSVEEVGGGCVFEASFASLSQRCA
jgi:hypothetical protein